MDNQGLKSLEAMLKMSGFVRVEQFEHFTWIHIKTKEHSICNCFLYAEGKVICFTRVLMEELSDRVKDKRSELVDQMNCFSHAHSVCVNFDSDGEIEIEKILLLEKNPQGEFVNGDEILKQTILNLLLLRKRLLEKICS